MNTRRSCSSSFSPRFSISTSTSNFYATCSVTLSHAMGYFPCLHVARLGRTAGCASAEVNGRISACGAGGRWDTLNFSYSERGHTCFKESSATSWSGEELGSGWKIDSGAWLLVPKFFNLGGVPDFLSRFSFRHGLREETKYHE